MQTVRKNKLIIQKKTHLFLGPKFWHSLPAPCSCCIFERGWSQAQPRTVCYFLLDGFFLRIPLPFASEVNLCSSLYIRCTSDYIQEEIFSVVILKTIGVHWYQTRVRSCRYLGLSAKGAIVYTDIP